MLTQMDLLPAKQTFPQALLVVLLLCSALVLLFLSPYSPNSINIFRAPPETHPSENSSPPVECDISRGEWVGDPEAPFYTNATCWMIQEHQNCIKYGRPDMEFLKWRWKPQGCELPAFDPALFLQLMRGKSLAFVGDSLARNQMQSLMCLLSRVEYPKDVSGTTDEDFKVMLYTNHNFTLSVFWSPFLIKGTHPNASDPKLPWDLYLNLVDDHWASHIDPYDYLILSAGTWFNRHSMFYDNGSVVGCSYCHSPNVTDLGPGYSHRLAFRTAFRAVNSRRAFQGVLFLRTLSPTHFEGGEWDRGGNCARTRPFRGGETTLQGLELYMYGDQVEEFRVAAGVARRRGLKFELLDTTEAMLLRPDGHPSRYGHWPMENETWFNDCVHWCLPGPVDVWNSFLLYKLQS
ncbi:hypothetical protein HPP92_017610 [Vanilla planifolia]|uniref:Trichome birefringence-like N-terminal domain-containing protein n=1 Tax=Vanilla planifolia TaxID=51239 RepID=A0A835QIC4_VANPL|nr:hypothetical protein HPP92_017610 [Vanilla planifolia]